MISGGSIPCLADDDAGHVAIAAFVKSSEKGIPDREHAIAQIARAVYGFFLFQPSAPAFNR